MRAFPAPRAILTSSEVFLTLVSAPSVHNNADHFAKPPLTADVSHPPPPHYTAYLEGLYQLALLPHAYLKLSALLDSADKATARAAFDEFKSGDHKKRRREGSYERLKARILSVLEPAIEAFGDERILVGSGVLIDSLNKAPPRGFGMT